MGGGHAGRGKRPRRTLPTCCAAAANSEAPVRIAAAVRRRPRRIRCPAAHARQRTRTLRGPPRLAAPRRGCQQCARRAFGDHLAAVDHDDPIGGGNAPTGWCKAHELPCVCASKRPATEHFSPSAIISSTVKCTSRKAARKVPPLRNPARESDQPGPGLAARPG